MYNARLNITLHKNQQTIHESRARFKVIKAGKRFGKTKWALFEICRAAGLVQNGMFWYIAPTYKQAKNIAWRALNWMLPKETVRRSVENELSKTLTTGSTIQLIGADISESLRGPELDGVIFDEAAYTNGDVWESIIRGQLLGHKTKTKRFAYFISSPNKNGRNWFSSFHERAMAKRMAGDKSWEGWYYTIYDNPTLDMEEVDNMRQDTTDDKWDLEYMALESAHSGIIYSEFNFNTHVHDTPIEKLELTVRGLDWGIDHPTVCLWVEVDVRNQKVYVSKEFYKSGFLISESCETIKQMTGEIPIEWSIIDPSCVKRNSQTVRTDKDEFQRWGIPCQTGDNRNRGYDITKMFFKKGFIHINPLCKNLIYQLRNVQYGDKSGDDATDALRYVLVRIHDYLFGGRLYSPETPVGYSPDPRELNMNDPNLFPEVKKDRNWITSELEVY